MSISVIQRRDSSVNPEYPHCPWHLRRACGTCEHFAGKLRSSEPSACAIDGLLRRANTSAANCDRWSRKVAK